eukprot:5550-Heterococcus_DN1.PRE.12
MVPAASIVPVTHCCGVTSAHCKLIASLPQASCIFDVVYGAQAKHVTAHATSTPVVCCAAIDVHDIRACSSSATQVQPPQTLSIMHVALAQLHLSRAWQSLKHNTMCHCVKSIAQSYSSHKEHCVDSSLEPVLYIELPLHSVVNMSSWMYCKHYISVMLDSAVISASLLIAH